MKGPNGGTWSWWDDQWWRRYDSKRRRREAQSEIESQVEDAMDEADEGQGAHVRWADVKAKHLSKDDGQMKKPVVVASLAREDVLLCGVRSCISVLSLITYPAPAAKGWVLCDGWWLCPDHADVIPSEGRS